MSKKVVFFDVDGTLLDSHMTIPASVPGAIRRLRKNGHMAVICSGRTRVYARDPALMALDFDGMVSGCGTMVEWGDEIVSYHRIAGETAVRAVEALRSYRFQFVLEGRDYIYFDEGEFTVEPHVSNMRKKLGEHLRSVSEDYGKWEISKIACLTEPGVADREGCIAELEDAFDFMIQNERSLELVPRGITKGTGIERLCEHLGVSREDTLCFGDSVNDLGMFAAVGTAIVMGNGSEEAKRVADYVTASVSEDGILRGLEHFHLLD